MKTITKSFLTGVLAFSLLMMPSGLSAKEKRGAEVVVTRADGSQVEGELIAVKRDSLLLLSDMGRDESVERENIRSVRIVKRSRTGGFSGVGALLGFAGGAALGLHMAAGLGGDRTTAALLFGLLGGGAGALAGLLTGTTADAVSGPGSTFTFKDNSAEAVAEYWEKLQRRSRVGRQKKQGPDP
jgi:hypothetical protein